MVQVAHQGAGAPQVHGGLGRVFARNYVRRSSLEYSGLRGEGSIPVPLPPPACPKFSILRLNLLVIKPSRATNSHLNSGLLIGRAAHSSPNGPFFSGALDSTDSVRFSKFECFERLMKSGGMEFCCSSRTGKSVRFRNRHIEVRILPPQPPIRAFGLGSPLKARMAGNPAFRATPAHPPHFLRHVVGRPLFALHHYAGCSQRTARVDLGAHPGVVAEFPMSRPTRR
jgi:hypothetical protein